MISRQPHAELAALRDEQHQNHSHHGGRIKAVRRIALAALVVAILSTAGLVALAVRILGSPS